MKTNKNKIIELKTQKYLLKVWKKKAIFDKIIKRKKYKSQMKYFQHWETSVYEHSINVAISCVLFVEKFKIKVNLNSLIKWALLHDYFLYNWHVYDPSHTLHGIKHARFAKKNAKRDYWINKLEENMIASHMFPLGITLPKYKESLILNFVDKYCSTVETFENIYYKIKKYQLYNKMIWKTEYLMPFTALIFIIISW